MKKWSLSDARDLDGTEFEPVTFECQYDALTTEQRKPHMLEAVNCEFKYNIKWIHAMTMDYDKSYMWTWIRNQMEKRTIVAIMYEIKNCAST